MTKFKFKIGDKVRLTQAARLRWANPGVIDGIYTNEIYKEAFITEQIVYNTRLETLATLGYHIIFQENIYRHGDHKETGFIHESDLELVSTPTLWDI